MTETDTYSDGGTERERLADPGHAPASGERTRTKADAEKSADVEERSEDERERITACPECDGRLATDTEHGETVCSDCGLVVEEDSVDRGPEWRAFNSGERDSKSRVGAPTTNMMHDKGLSTNIGWQDKD
ncbi:TFIIB-type zinc ribbon-containing protein, partial [Halorubrum distributum]